MTPAEIAKLRRQGEGRDGHHVDTRITKCVDEIERLRGLVVEAHQPADGETCGCGTELTFPDGADCGRCCESGSVIGPMCYNVPCPACMVPALAAHVAEILDGTP